MNQNIFREVSISYSIQGLKVTSPVCVSLFVWEPNISCSYTIKYKPLSRKVSKSIKEKVDLIYVNTNDMNKAICYVKTLIEEATDRQNRSMK